MLIATWETDTHRVSRVRRVDGTLFEVRVPHGIMQRTDYHKGMDTDPWVQDL